MTGLRAPRRLALITITVLVSAASAASFAESYRGLFLWAEHHGLAGIWAAGFPLQVDVFIAVGELALFVALADRWPPRSRAAAWTVTALGLAVSIAGNVGHVAGSGLASRATAAVPPLAAAAALAVGLGVLKRVVAMAATAPATDAPAPEVPAGLGHADRAAELFADDLARGEVPGVRRIRREMHLGQPRAQQVREHLTVLAEANGHGPAAAGAS